MLLVNWVQPESCHTQNAVSRALHIDHHVEPSLLEFVNECNDVRR